jgi:hypothetical protein
MKIVISNNDHSVDVEIADDTPGLDVNEFMAMTRDLYCETYKTPAPKIGFERNRDG